MNNNTKVILGIVALAVGASIIETVITAKHDREREARIRRANLEHEEEVAAIRIAAAKTRERIIAGELQSLAEIETCFEFEKIAARFNK